MKTPAFWSGKPSVFAWLLSPLGWIYGAVTAKRMAKAGTTVDLPVICVGNFTAGGAGKTPVVLMLADALMETGERPFVISRGYGGNLKVPTRVDVNQHSASECGDEPLLLASRVPTVVAKDRVAGAALAKAQGATLLLLDDGLQNPALTKDFTIAVVDAGVGVGNGFCVPAGPLRAPLLVQMPYVNVILMVGETQTDHDIIFAAQAANKPVLFGHLQPGMEAVAELHGLQLLAFAGIGRPEKFFETLRQSGLDVVQTRAFADHYPYSDADIIALRQEAESKKLVLVTTEKDLVRIKSSTTGIKILPVLFELANLTLLDQLKKALLTKPNR